MLLPILLVTPLLQDAGSPGADRAPDQAAPRAVSAEDLKARIHGMRMDLLLGGERVRAAESEAVAFYGQKRELVDQRLDGIRADLSEKRAGYDVLLDRALSAPDAQARSQALGEAGLLRGEIEALEAEATELRSRRDRLNELVGAVEARDRDRQKLVAQIETSPDAVSALGGLPFAGIGLAPAVPATAPGSPLEDDRLVADLLERDPVGARAMLFEMDPTGYFERFPLHPPAAALPAALPFPLPDPPGRR